MRGTRAKEIRKIALDFASRIAIAGRYAERHTIKKILADAQIDDLPVQITASWLDAMAEADGDMTDAQALEQVDENFNEIAGADILLYFPSWWIPSGDQALPDGSPRWSPGRLIDYGMALACGLELIIVGTPEPSIYFRGHGPTVCTPETLCETIKKAIER